MNWLYRQLIPNSLNAMPDMPMQSDFSWRVMVLRWEFVRTFDRLLLKGGPRAAYGDVQYNFSGMAELVNPS